MNCYLCNYNGLHRQDLKNTNSDVRVKTPLFLIAPKSIWATYSRDQKHMSGNHEHQLSPRTQTQWTIWQDWTLRTVFLTGVTVAMSGMSGKINPYEWEIYTRAMWHTHLGRVDSTSLIQTRLLPAKGLDITVFNFTNTIPYLIILARTTFYTPKSWSHLKLQ